MSHLILNIDQAGVWSINPYYRCSHSCQYCIARSQGESTPWYLADDLLPNLRAGLRLVPDDVELFIGAMADAYPPEERELGLTRLVLEELIAQQRNFCINTKSDLVCREIDLLKSYRGHGDGCLSICSLNEGALCALEPGAPTVSQRLTALRQLHAAGIEVCIDAAPWIPGISDAAALIELLPPGVTIQFAPLSLHHCGGRISFLGHEYQQDETDAAYQQVRANIGQDSRVIWKDPIL